MPTLSQQKILRKLSAKKHRWAQRLFVAEGRKVVAELLAENLAPAFWMAEQNSHWIKKGAEPLSKKDLQEWSFLETADEVLAVFPFPEFEDFQSDKVLILDGMKDPGNLGTLVRTADWFGFRQIFCAPGTVDLFNPKTVQSTMGSLARVQVFYLDNEEIFLRLENHYSLASAEMRGTDYRDFKPAKRLALILGNESHGVSEFWKGRSENITILKNEKSGAESLNAAIAGGILMSHF